ncbi:MAG: hypothetical protein M1830_001975 [Pleopsidium flavum]|nr:MAG: hypothetical protein M1830_001975 [Pleopsidium flavum]
MGASNDEFPLLGAFGLYAADIRGDGNCLFNALSDQLYGTQSSHQEIRTRVIDYMREHASYYKQFIDVHPGGGVRRNPKRKNAGAYSTPVNYFPPTPEEVDRVFESHLQQMIRGGTYGDNMEITAFSAAFGVDVKIYQRDFAYMVSGRDEDVKRDVVHIAYHIWEHYSSIRNISGPHTGLPHVKATFLSPQAEAEHKDKLSKTPYVLPWMVNVVTQSLPYLADRATIQKALEDCKGSIDNAVSKLLDAEERGSLSSAQESSSVEREPDSDEEALSGPNKKQDRRLSRATRTVLKEKEEQRKRDLALRLKDPKPPKTNGHIPHEEEGNKHETDPKYEDADETEEEDWRDATFKDSESASASASASDYSSTNNNTTTTSRPKPNGVKLKLSQPKRDLPNGIPTILLNNNNTNTTTISGPKTQQKQQSPKPKRVTQRDKRDIKKAAQKAAQKERRQGVAVGKAINGTAGLKGGGGVSLVLKNGKENTPAIEAGIKTLYI